MKDTRTISTTDFNMPNIGTATLLHNGLSLEHNNEFLKGLEQSLIGIGPVFDIGCWTGTISFLTAAYFIEHNIDRTIYLFDTFKGHPESCKSDVDNEWQFDINCFKTPNIDVIRKTFDRIGFDKYEIIEGDITETLKDINITPCFASIDMNYYNPTKTALNYLSTHHYDHTIIWEDDLNNIKGIDKAYNERTDLESINLGQTRGAFFKFKQ